MLFVCGSQRLMLEYVPQLLFYLVFWDGVSHWTWWQFCLDWLASEILWGTCLCSPVLMSTNAFHVGTRDMNLSPHTWSVSTSLSEPYPWSLNSQLHICPSMSMDSTSYEMKIFKEEKQNFNCCWHILWLGLKRLVSDLEYILHILLFLLFQKSM